MKSLTVGQKLMVSFGALLVLLCILATVTLYSFSTMQSNFDTAVNKTAKKLLLSDAVNTAESDMMVGERGFILYSLSKRSQDAVAGRKTFVESNETAKRAIEDLRPFLVTPEGKAMVDKLATYHRDWEESFTEIEALVSAGKLDEALNVSYEKDKPIYLNAAELATKLQQQQTAFLASDVESAQKQAAMSRWLAIAIVVLGLVVGAGVLIIVRQITRALTQFAEELADGSDQVASAASQVSSSSQALAQGASEQAASLEETSSSTEEINSMTQKNAENSSAAANLTAEAMRHVQAGNESVAQMVGSMQEINESSDKISKIIKVIDEIAFQTNILALNAAVEAARAGEAGMGFAVVADEVRNLAQRCAQAAKDTANLIEDSIKKTADGKRKLEQVEAAISTITENCEKVRVLVDEVNVGSQEQKRGLEQISKAVVQIEQVTQRTAASAEESAAAGEELNAQSETLNQLVDRLGAFIGRTERSAKPSAGKRAHSHTSHLDLSLPPSKKQAIPQVTPKHIQEEEFVLQ